MKKILLFLLLCLIPFSVNADEADIILQIAQTTNTQLENYMKTLDENCKNGSDCDDEWEQFSKNGSEVSKILSNAEKYNLTDEPIIKELQANYDVYVNSSKGGFGQNWSFSLSTGCSSIYGGGLGDWLNNFFTFVKYIGLALVVVLSTMDFLKVVIGDKDDELKKAFGRFVKRFIAVVLLFLTPVLINFVFDILGDNISGSDGTSIDVCTDYIK